MIWWILLWLGSPAPGGTPAPTPDVLPFLRRDGRDLGPLPVIVRRG